MIGRKKMLLAVKRKKSVPPFAFNFEERNPLIPPLKHLKETEDMNGEEQEKKKKINSDSDISRNHHPSTNHDTNPNSSQIFRWDSESMNQINIHGFDYELMVLLKKLKKGENNNGFQSIGIIGVPGIGKSTICQTLLKNPEIKKEFFPRIWISMSRPLIEDGNPKIALLKRILTSLGVEKKIIDANFPSSQTLSCLLYALFLQLKGKKYLIVFDDVKEKEINDNWYWDLNSCLIDYQKMDEKLTYGLPKGNGGLVIVTSRSEKAAKSMVGEENLHHVLPFSDKESFWEIFKEEVERNGDSYDPLYLEELKEELVKKCGGIPLAAKMMGQIKKERLRSLNGSMVNQG